MKKLVSLILTMFLVLASISAVSVSAASDFVIEDGVLLSYKGSGTSVSIPSDVYYIADSAFEGNTKITSVSLNMVEFIGDKAFYGCTALKSVTNHAYVASCGAYAFENTPFLANNTNTNVILGSVLIKSTASGSLTIPESVTSIAPYSFFGNTKLTGVTVSGNVAEIGEGAFYNCSSLATVTISKNVAYIGAYAFEGTKWLSAQTSDFVVVGSGILIDANTTSADIVIPDTVRHIASGVFYRNTKLKSVKFSSNLSGIGMRAFSGCTALSSVEFPTSLVLIDTEAFSGCTSLKSVVIPATVTLLGDSVFLGCTALNTASVYSSADINAGMFAGCTALKSVMIASQTKVLGDYAFYNCTNLSEISLPDTITQVSSTAFNGSSKLSVFCNENTYVFTRCESLKVPVYQIGDSNLDGVVNIRDATHIQKYLTDLATLNFSATLRSDVDFNGVLNVRDATKIQKILAGLL